MCAIETSTTRNAIWSNGHVRGLPLESGDRLIVRDYDPSGPTPRPIPVVIEQLMAVEPGGMLDFRFDADAWGSTISFQPGIPVSLGGELELAFVAGVDPATQVGRTFDLFDWTGVNPVGAFNVVSDYEWDTSRLYTTGEVTLVPEPGAVVLLLVVAVGLAVVARRGSLRLRQRNRTLARAG